MGSSRRSGVSYILTDRLFHLGPTYSLMAGIGLIFMAVTNPVGISGANREMWEMAKSRLRRVPPSAEHEPSVQDELVLPSSSSVTRTALDPDRSMRGLRLRTNKLSVTYRGLRAVDHVTLEVREGEIVGLIGPNGAGKTSFVDGLTVFTKTSGGVEFLGADIESEPAHKRMRRGLSRTWQSVELFDDLTVYENLRVAREHDTLRSLPADVVRPLRSVDEQEIRFALRLIGLADKADRYPYDLSLGQQKVAGVARAMCTKLAVLLLDEPAAGLDSRESVLLGERLRDITADGTAILLIDRHGPRPGDLRLHLRARARSSHRRGYAGHDPVRSRSHRGLPGSGRTPGGRAGRGERGMNEVFLSRTSSPATTEFQQFADLRRRWTLGPNGAGKSTTPLGRLPAL